MYHAVLAALLEIGICAKAHYCAIAAFKEFYVKRGRVKPEYITYIKRAKQLEQKYANTLEKAQGDRVVEQYGVEVLTNDDTEWILGDAKDIDGFIIDYQKEEMKNIKARYTMPGQAQVDIAISLICKELRKINLKMTGHGSTRLECHRMGLLTIVM